MSSSPTRRLLFAAALMLVLVLVAWIHNVPKQPTDEDITAINAMLEATGSGELIGRTPLTFEKQIRTVVAVQDAVLARASEDRGLPLGSPREPKNLDQARHGLCYDRGRAIEKALRLAGFEVRYVSVYSTDESSSAAVRLLTHQGRSHVVIEARSIRGWLAVDTNARWLSLDADNRPWSMASLKRVADLQLPMPEWSGINRAAIYDLLEKPFIFVPGLYSRHGLFYPPYTPIPDVNWHDLINGLFRRAEASAHETYRLTPPPPPLMSSSPTRRLLW